MKLYCVINDKRYEIVEGATFAEEYNETLDSGTIMLDQVTKIENLEPFDDVYIYDDETNGNLFYKHMLIDKFNEELNNLNFGNDEEYIKLYKYKIDLFSETKRLEKVILPNISITQPADKNRRRSVWEYLNVYLNLYSPKMKILSDDFTWSYKNKYSFSNFHDLPDEYEEVEFLQSTGTQWIRTGLQIQEGDRIVIEFNDFESNGKYICGQNDQATTGNPYFQIGGASSSPMWNLLEVSQHKTGNMYEFVFTHVNNPFNGYFGLFCTTYNDGPLGSGAGSGKIDYIRQYRDNILISNLIPCKRKSDGVLGFYDLKGEHTFYTNMGTGEFLYENKRHPAHFDYNSVHDLFADVDAPEMSLTNPTLRDVISQLMLTKDCIPVVHDDIIDYIDVSQRHGEFKTDPQYVNFIHSGMTSEEFATEARREYSGALSQENTCKMIEYLGFRNSNKALLTRKDLVLETRYPIYKINKIYMCYYKQAKVFEVGTGVKDVHFMCKQDITPLVVQNVTRQALSMDFENFNDLINKPGSNAMECVKDVDIEDLAKYKICTVGYNIGSNQITGWDEEYTYFSDLAYWFKRTQTILENIISFMDAKTPFGYKKAGIVLTNENQSVMSTSYSGLSSIDTGNLYPDAENLSQKQKAVFFEIDYNAMFGGAIVHSKDFKDKDDLTTVDNCSSSLTVLEADGLFEKEKMNRLGNRQYNIQARYEGTNAYSIMNGSTCNHILGSVLNYSNRDDDVVIYHKEYQIYDNVILSNYAGTFDYVLKNYFTSVFAKLRTYNLATYDESVVRAENYKEYIILNDDKAIFENSTLMYNNLSKYISCFLPTLQDENTYNQVKNNQINFGYIQTKFNGDLESVNNSKAFCDINTFCSGYSMCVNLKMYDNVSQGIYIKYPQQTNENVIGSVQEWAIAVDDEEDAFQEKMAFGFGHLFQDGDSISENDLDPDGNRKEPFVPEYGFDISTSIGDIYNNQLLKLPNFNSQNYVDYNSAYHITAGSNNGLIIYKDNKEVLDYTFQFETITNSKDILFSSYFVKLNDMSGIYSRWEKSDNQLRDFGIVPNLQFNGELEYTFEEISSYPYQRYNLLLWLTVPKNSFISDYSPYSMLTKGISIDIRNVNYWINNPQQQVRLNYYPKKLTVDAQGNATILYTRSTARQVVPGVINPVWKPEAEWTDFEESLTKYHEDNDYYYFKIILLQNIETTWNSSETFDVSQLNRVVEFDIKSSDANESADYLQQQHIMTKNMFAIISTEKLKKEIMYDTYLSTYVWYLTKVDKNKTYVLLDGGIYESALEAGEEGYDFDVTFTVPDHPTPRGVPYTQIFIDGQYLYYKYVYEGETFRTKACEIHVGAPNPVAWETGYNQLIFSGGSDLNSKLFLKWLTKTTSKIKITSFSGINIQGLPSYMQIINTDDESNEIDSNYYIAFKDLFKFVPVNSSSTIATGTYILYSVVSFPEFAVNLTVNFSIKMTNPETGTQETKYFSGIAFENGTMKYIYRYTSGSIDVYDEEDGWIDVNYQYITIEDSQDFSTDFKVWLENNTDDYDYANIPTIHVGNQLLSNYDQDPNNPIRSIQYWYLDNNGEGAGRLHFVFGVNIEPGQYQKDIYVSVATKRSPYVYTQDHKHIIGKIKQMNALNYAETNEIDLNGGGDVYLNEPIVNEEKLFLVSIFVDNQFFNKIRIDENQDIYYISDSGESVLVYEDDEWVKETYKHILLIGSEFRENEEFVEWLLASSYEQFTVENAYAGQNAIGFKAVNEDSTLSYNKPILEFSRDRISWEPYVIGRNLILEENEKVYFRGQESNRFYIDATVGSGRGTCFNATQNFNVSGRLMSLIDPSSERTSLYSQTLSTNAVFKYLFKDCTTLVDAHDLILGATVLCDNCYEGMFYNCTNLVSAPATLPAQNASGLRCYGHMFAGCSNLVNAPDLLFTTVSGRGACEYMFNDCSSLVNAPEILAINTTQECYYYMFAGCSSLVSTPILEPTSLGRMSCASMFSGCSNLTTINIDFKNIADFGVSCCEYMFGHCSSLTYSPAIGMANSTTSTHSFFYMFWHCEALTQLGYIYPKNLTSGCCEDMFSYCTSLEVSSSQTEEFIYAYPFTATPGGTYSFQLYMFEDTAGPYTGGGALGTTYYLKYAPIE